MKTSRKYAINAILCTVVLAAVFAVVMRELSYPWSDYSLHLQWAVNFRKEFSKLFTSVSEFQFQYPMWHILVNLSYKLLRFFFGDISPDYAAVLVTLLLKGVIYFLIEKVIAYYGCSNSEVIAFGLSFVMPIYHKWETSSMFYFGQGSPVVWHSPSNMIVKPFSIIGFFLIIQILDKIEKKKNVRKEYIFLTIIIFLSTLAKPSFFQGIVPALGLYILIKLFSTKFENFKAYCLLCACFIPGFLIIIFQFLLVFFIGEGGEGIGFGWMEIAKNYYAHPWLQFFLTLTFPFCYILFNLDRVKNKTEIILSVLYVFCSWFEYVLLYENGIRKLDGNFEWAVCLAYTVIWIVTSTFFFKDWQDINAEDKKEKIKNIFLFLVWMAHFVSGLYFLWGFLTVIR